VPEHQPPHVDPLEVQYAAPSKGQRARDEEFQKRTSRSASYWEIEDVEAQPVPSASAGRLWGGRTADGSPTNVAPMNVAVEAPAFAPLPPPMIDKPDPMLVAIIADDEDVEAEDRGGPHFVGAGNLAAPVGPPGLGAERSETAPVTAPGTFMAAWSLSAKEKMQKSRRARRTRRRLTRLLGLFLLAVGAYFAYPYLHAKIVARSVAADLRPYVEGKGVVYTPAGRGYSVRLPKGPTPRETQLSAVTMPLAIGAHVAIAAGRDYQVAVVQGDLPGRARPKDLLALLQDPKIGGTGTITGARRTRIAGDVAYEGTFVASRTLPRRVGVFVHGRSLFVLRVQAQAAGPVFDELTKSFRFAPPG
jgi:hypothetical protein